MEILKPNKILIIGLKRFHEGKKNEIRVTFPFSLQLTEKTMNERYHYKIYAMILHSGTLTSGHYIAVCFDEKDSSWKEYSDSHIRTISKEKFLPKVNQRDVYALFYRLVSPVRENSRVKYEHENMEVKK